jgi:hypothetical protein
MPQHMTYLVHRVTESVFLGKLEYVNKIKEDMVADSIILCFIDLLKLLC